jgi:hypothetical protein
MAHAGPNGFHLNEHSIVITIGGDLFHHQSMAGRFALEPELVSGAAVESYEARFHRLLPGFFIHETDHKDASGFVVLHDRGYQAVEFCEV